MLFHILSFADGLFPMCISHKMQVIIPTTNNMYPLRIDVFFFFSCPGGLWAAELDGSQIWENINNWCWTPVPDLQSEIEREREKEETAICEIGHVNKTFRNWYTNYFRQNAALVAHLQVNGKAKVKSLWDSVDSALALLSQHKREKLCDKIMPFKKNKLLWKEKGNYSLLC